MTATLYRRLVDLPPGLLSRWPEARTTDECDAPHSDIAEDIRRACHERDLRVFVAILSHGQARVIEAPDSEPKTLERILRRLDTDANATPLRQRIKDYSDTLEPRGEPLIVACLWDGRIRPDVSQRSRSRRDKRFTLDADVLDWIETESARRGESQSAVVQDALRDAMDMHKTVDRLKAEGTKAREGILKR